MLASAMPKSISIDLLKKELKNSAFSLGDMVRFIRLAMIYRKQYLGKNSIFIHNPKCAGQSIGKALYGKSLGHSPPGIIRACIGFDEYKKHKKIVFVRCPVERLISAYNFSLTGGTSVVKQDRFRRVPKKYLGDFETFCYNRLFKQSPKSLDYLLRDQSNWILSNNKQIIVNSILDISQLNVCMAKEFGINTPITQINKSIQKQSKEKTFACQPCSRYQDVL